MDKIIIHVTLRKNAQIVMDVQRNFRFVYSDEFNIE